MPYFIGIIERYSAFSMSFFDLDLMTSHTPENTRMIANPWKIVNNPSPMQMLTATETIGWI